MRGNAVSANTPKPVIFKTLRRDIFMCNIIANFTTSFKSIDRNQKIPKWGFFYLLMQFANVWANIVVSVCDNWATGIV